MRIERSKMEILAPVGGQTQLEAAVRAGADAVYLGTRGFNARQNAENFDDLSSVVSFCHARGVRVHVTVNTLILDCEMRQLEQTADQIAQSGADAVIIQDLAVLRCFQKKCPAIELHASTQMAVHNLDGARMLKDLGFHRMVLARELSLDEIERITSKVDLEAESFVHGAICMSLSGGCYMSSMIGGRSGNRGYCAQPCRLDFRCDGAEYALSLKDMSYIGHLQELADAGVSSLKIEGRMKRAEYVAAAVDACVQAKAGRAYDEKMLEGVFSRSGFTDGFLTGRIDSGMFGVRTKEDIEETRLVQQKIHELYRRERQCVAVSALCSVGEDTVTLRLSDGVHTVSTEKEGVQEARNRATDTDQIRDALQKLGNTPFVLATCRVRGRQDRYLPASLLNALRRDAAEKLLAERSAPHPHPVTEWDRNDPVPHTAMRSVMWARFETPDQIPENTEDLEKVILPSDMLAEDVLKRRDLSGKIVAELPSICYPSFEEKLERRVRELQAEGLSEVMVNNLYGVSLASRLGLEWHGGWGLNVTNTEAFLAFEEMGASDLLASFELNMEDVSRLGGTAGRGIILYGYLPLMRMRACPGKKAGGCAGCKGERTMTDRTGRTFRLKCEGRRYSVLYNSVPLYIADRKRAVTEYGLLYFTRESKKETREILCMTRERETPAFDRTGGMYYRKLQ